MKNSEISYKLSSDFAKLYKLLKEGKKLVGFEKMMIDNRVTEYSHPCELSYRERHKCFSIPGSIFESERVNKEKIIEFFGKYLIGYIDPN